MAPGHGRGRVPVPSLGAFAVAPDRQRERLALVPPGRLRPPSRRSPWVDGLRRIALRDGELLLPRHGRTGGAGADPPAVPCHPVAGSRVVDVRPAEPGAGGAALCRHRGRNGIGLLRAGAHLLPAMVLLSAALLCRAPRPGPGGHRRTVAGAAGGGPRAGTRRYARRRCPGPGPVLLPCARTAVP